MTKEKEYKEFVKAVEQEMAVQLGVPEENVSFEKGENEGERDRILIKTEYENGLTGVMGIEAASLFLLYKRGAAIETLAKQVKNDWKKKCTSETLGILMDMEDYEKLKERLIIRAISFTENEKQLKGTVYRRFGDIALVVYLKLRETEYDFLSAKVQKQVLEKWGKEEKEVFDSAMINTHVLYPPRIYDWLHGNGKFGYREGAFMNPLEPFFLEKGPQGNCLTNVKQLNGATALFYPGVAKRIGALLGEDFYVVFTSIHEAMIHGATTVAPEIIRASLESVNASNEKTEILSDKVYYYSRKNNSLTAVL